MAVMNDEEEVVCEEKELDNMCSRDLCKSTKEVVNDIYDEDDKDDVMSQILPSQDRGCVKSDPNKLWLNVCLHRLKQILNVTDINDLVNYDLLSAKNVMENVESNFRCVTKDVPKSLILAMKYLIYWPQSIEFSVFENVNSVFGTIQEYFESLSEPLVESNLVKVFNKISGLIKRCKVSALRALQNTLLLIKKEKRQMLQLLLRFMVKISNNHQLNLNHFLPTRELVIQTFVPCIFGDKDRVDEILEFVYQSFGKTFNAFTLKYLAILSNFLSIFYQQISPAMRFQFEQHFALLRARGNEGEMLKTGQDIAFCFRVTKQEYEEQKKFETQRSLEELLHCIVEQENVSKKNRRKMLKQFQKTYPEIYFNKYPIDDPSVMS
ncbi:DEP domain-containing protein 1B-like [Xenia sp. Carnegie-2017]|uniref:DEP domain-containing protein 1B-like n=1 Tax=Xenia sp. Carnegie-2017 TaxID=2897299 RepID=UPI001F049B8A|nr:DEP domain-containing protein 1B-like [Xenia sp. Carnegie-2017]